MATQWFEDPAVLDNYGARFIEWAKHPGQYVYPYECDPSFALEYQQAGQRRKLMPRAPTSRGFVSGTMDRMFTRIADRHLQPGRPAGVRSSWRWP